MMILCFNDVQVATACTTRTNSTIDKDWEKHGWWNDRIKGLIDIFELSMENLVIILYMFDYSIILFDYSIIINNLIIVFTIISFLSMVMNFMYRFAYNIERDAPYFLVE